MLTYEEIEKVVVGIAKSYAKDKVNGRGWSKDKFEEYRQELFLEAYSLLEKNKEMHINYLAKSLWNKAGELFYKNTKYCSSETVTGLFQHDTDEAKNTNEKVHIAMYNASVDKSYFKYEDVDTPDLVKKVLELIKNKPDDIKKFVIARLKLSGYLSESSFPEVQVSRQDYEEANITENHKILKDILNMNGAPSGGTNKFKNNKRELFLELISEFDVEDTYRKWYEVRYLDENNKEQIDVVKKFSETEVKEYLCSSRKVTKIVSIMLEE